MPDRTSYVTLFLRFLGAARSGDPPECSGGPPGNQGERRRLRSSEAYLRFLEVARSHESVSVAGTPSAEAPAERAEPAEAMTWQIVEETEERTSRTAPQTYRADEQRPKYRSAGGSE